MSDTIAAISRASGEAGIGIVRISGPGCADIKQRLVTAYPGDIKYFNAPDSYTGEDYLEIFPHDDSFAPEDILKAVLDTGYGNIRMAEPGEFARRTVMNGRMDLTQAEAVIDIINAGSELSLSIAESQRAGNLGEEIRDIRDTLLDIMAEIDDNMDSQDEYDNEIGYGDFYSDEDEGGIVGQLRWVLSDVQSLLDTAPIGRIARDGIRLVIAGKPNSGKSSLMNALLGESKVTVADAPGTTKDTIEERVTISGIPAVLVDTAGLKETDDNDEKIGIERTAQAMASADLIILVLDGSHDLDDKDDTVLRYIEKMDNEHLLVVINKNDLGVSISEKDVLAKMPQATVVRTSLVEGGIPEAVRQVSDAVLNIYDLGSINTEEKNIITSDRHIRLLRNARMNLEEAIYMLRNDESAETAELSVGYAYDSLGKIIGEEAGEEVLNTVFSKFCLGE